ncbi:hypothetical protein [Frigoribacterium sp. 9N]|uniref:hypothetical protein n=1 Tax=Frigoribacterium sp. 9N TaxID=2653144 RepID=UPI0012EF9EF4|nr:hypothetical protein [Frigoribacterium sp. 9N]VXB75773.1 hypothetical protein FRIGORI9N_420027 [Frigoribacterium sp. 9N]
MADKKSTENDAPLSLGAAKKLTGFSETKFKTEKNRDKLSLAGAKLVGTGKEWEIRPSQLIALGWLNEDGSPLAMKPRRPRGSGPVSTSRSRYSDIEENGDLEALDSQLEDERESLTSIDEEIKQVEEKLAEVKKLEQKRRELTTRRSDVAARAKALTSRIEKVEADVATEVERVRKNAEYLEKRATK